VADAEGWDIRRCTVPLSLRGVDSLDIRATSSDPGWRIVLLEPDDVRTPGLLNASNNRTVIDDFGDGPLEFLLGAQVTCSALGGTILEFALVGSSNGVSTPLEAVGTLSLEPPILPAPSVVITAATIGSSGDIPTGSVAITWERGGPATCPWQITLALAGVDALEVIELTGSEGVSAVTMPGVVVITVPPANPSGDIELDLAFSGGTPTAVSVEAQVRP
jgi:hypothetical protein